MKKPVPNKPTFDPANRRLDFSNTPNFDICRLYGVTNIRTGQLIYSPIRPALAPANIAGAVLTLSFNTNGMLPADPLFIEYNDGINDLPPNASTATNQVAEQGLLSDIKAALLAQIDFEETVWIDPATGKFYARRVVEAEGTGGYTVVWTDPAGTAVTPPAGVEPAARTQYHQIESTFFDVLTPGAGYAVGDVLARVLVFDTRTNTVAASFWHNMSQGTAIAAPPAANVVEQTKAVVATSPQLPTTIGPHPAAQSTSVTLSADDPLYASLGEPTDPPAADDVASATVVSLLRRGLARWTTFLGRFPAALGATTAANSLAVTLATDGVFVTLVNQLIGLVRGSTVTADVAGVLAAGGTAVPVAANLARQFAEITNTGGDPLSYRWGAAATATAGHILSPGESARYDSKVPTAALNLFSANGTSFFVTTG